MPMCRAGRAAGKICRVLMQACACILRAIAEWPDRGDQASLHVSDVLSQAEGHQLLELVTRGLDVGPQWLKIGVTAGADVLRVLRSYEFPEPIEAEGLVRRPQVQPLERWHSTASSMLSAASSNFSTDSQQPSYLFLKLRPRMVPADSGAASEALLSGDGVAAELVSLAGNWYPAARLAALSCMRVLACSPVGAALIATQPGAVDALAQSLRFSIVESGGHVESAAAVAAATALAEADERALHALQAEQFMLALEAHSSVPDNQKVQRLLRVLKSRQIQRGQHRQQRRRQRKRARAPPDSVKTSERISDGLVSE